MKKSLALIITFVVILTCFAACKKEQGKLEGGVLATNSKGQVVAAVVTEENGKLQRGDGGNAVILVTDVDGNNVKDNNGEVVTKVEAIDDAIIIGNRIEMADYAINIPDGWADSLSIDDLHIKKNGTEDQISISVLRDAKLEDIVASNSKIMDAISSDKKTNKSLTVAGEEANLVSAFTVITTKNPETGKEEKTEVYFGLIAFSHQGAVYNCRIDSNHDLSGEIDKIIAILNTIEFVN